ncbi:hypothetical protein GA0115238_115810 [Streptomyces sp. di50b]|nr:hypothetical protein GA0115238_115810 [Streptomyces sp. di50b]
MPIRSISIPFLPRISDSADRTTGMAHPCVPKPTAEIRTAGDDTRPPAPALPAEPRIRRVPCSPFRQVTSVTDAGLEP